MIVEKREQSDTMLLYNIVSTPVFTRLFNLTEKENTVLQMRWQYGLTFSVIGKNLRVSDEMARVYFNNAIKKIEKSLHLQSQLQNTVVLSNITEQEQNRFILIDSLEGISSKTKAELFRLKIYTLHDLGKYSRKELLIIRFMGAKRVAEIENAIHQFGLALKES